MPRRRRGRRRSSQGTSRRRTPLASPGPAPGACGPRSRRDPQASAPVAASTAWVGPTEAVLAALKRPSGRWARDGICSVCSAPTLYRMRGPSVRTWAASSEIPRTSIAHPASPGSRSSASGRPPARRRTGAWPPGGQGWPASHRRHARPDGAPQPGKAGRRGRTPRRPATARCRRCGRHALLGGPVGPGSTGL
jgi:hypothetical protein